MGLTWGWRFLSAANCIPWTGYFNRSKCPFFLHFAGDSATGPKRDHVEKRGDCGDPPQRGFQTTLKLVPGRPPNYNSRNRCRGQSRSCPTETRHCLLVLSMALTADPWLIMRITQSRWGFTVLALAAFTM